MPGTARSVAEDHPSVRGDDVLPRDDPFALDDDPGSGFSERSSCGGPRSTDDAITRPRRVPERETFFPENVTVTQPDRVLTARSR